NGSTIIRVNARNGEPGGGGSHRRPMALTEASNVLVTIPNLPMGVTFGGVDQAAWACALTTDAAGTTKTLQCSLPDLAEGAATTADITLNLDATVTALALTPTISADGADPYVADTPLSVPVTQIANSIGVFQDTGDLIVIGNASVTCDDVASATCADARDADLPLTANPSLNRQDQPMVLLGADAGAGVTNASSATLTLPQGATVAKAYLVWGGLSDVMLPPTAQPAELAVLVGSATVSTGGLGATVLASNVARLEGNVYSAWKDVTSSFTSLSGTVEITVSNLHLAATTASFGGWSLIVVTHDTTQPERLMVVSLPNASFSTPATKFTASIPFAGSANSTEATVGIVALEGDRGRIGDYLDVGSGRVGNAFNGAVTGGRTPSYKNNFGFDLTLHSTSITAGDTPETDRVVQIEAGVDGASGDLVRLIAITYAITLD
ncbi:MAG TPA: hypothetical protein PLV68_05450, partial [Ilumatobacteraceae bacterium]|nr:hypothetical protein [Ilumatobacteraceae bacterium]